MMLSDNLSLSQRLRLASVQLSKEQRSGCAPLRVPGSVIYVIYVAPSDVAADFGKRSVRRKPRSLTGPKISHQHGRSHGPQGQNQAIGL